MKLKKESALLIGNGINRVEEETDGQLSWDNLLLLLLEKEFSNSNNPYYLEIKELLQDHNDKGKYTEQKSAFIQEISNPEIFDAIYNFRATNITDREKNAIKRELFNIMPLKKSDKINLPIHKKITTFASNNNIPILTTNFDCNFEFSDSKLQNSKFEKNKGYRPLENKKSKDETSSYWYPYNYCFTEQTNIPIQDVLHTYAVWHIHGYPFFVNSICIGAKDYGYSISRYNKLIGNKVDGLYVRKNNEISEVKNTWMYDNTWLHIFLTVKNLYIIGLGLNSDETSLRWLLQERRRAIKVKYNGAGNTCYITKKREIGIGKKFFLNSLGIKIETVDDYSEMYELEIE